MIEGTRGGIEGLTEMGAVSQSIWMEGMEKGAGLTRGKPKKEPLIF